MKAVYKSILVMTVILIAGFSLVAFLEDDSSVFDENSMKYKINKVNSDIKSKFYRAFDK